MTDTARPRAVVSLSGGMDSVVCAALASRDFETYAVHFSYGQRTETRELLAAQDAVRILGIRELLHQSSTFSAGLEAPPLPTRASQSPTLQPMNPP